MSDQKRKKILGISSIVFFLSALAGLLVTLFFISRIADQPEVVEFGQEDREINLLADPASEDLTEVTPTAEAVPQ